MTRPLIRVAAALAVAVLPLAVAAPASAHATVEISNPAPEQVLAKPPHEVSVHFDEGVTLVPGSLRVFGPDGRRVDDGHVAYAPGDGSTIEVAVAPDGAGTYLLSWHVISADSHPVSGAFSYSVGHASKVPTASAITTDPTVDTALDAARVAAYLGCALLLGAGAFALYGGSRRSSRLARGGGILLAVASIAMVLLKGPLDAGLGLGAVGRGSLLHEVLTTTYGGAALARVGLALVGALVVTRLRGRVGGGVLAVLGAGVAITFALSGHAVSSPFAVLVDVVHVVGMSLWLGGLIALLTDALPRRDATAIGRFSSIALGAVVALVATGSYQGWRQVRSWGALTGTTYGRELLIKVAIVVAVVAVAGWSRRSVSGAGWAVLKRTVALEVAGVALILGASSTLSVAQPAAEAWQPDVSERVTILGDAVRISAVPAGDRTMAVQLAVVDAHGDPVEPAELDASVSLPSQQLGPLPITLTTTARGHRSATVSVPVAGDWTLTVTLRTTAIDEDTRTVAFPIH